VGYYLLILLAVALFGCGFGLQEAYRRLRGSGLRISMESACIGAFAGLVVLLAMDGFSFEYTPFTLLMATLTALNGIAFTFCAFRALDHINLSLFSLFTMLGGMVLPFVQGVLFYGENITVAKIICVIFIVAALACTVVKGERKQGGIFYAGIFILNGMSGVLSKLYTAGDFPKASAAGYSAWCAALTVMLSGTAWLILCLWERSKRGRGEKKDGKVWRSYGIGALQGSINKIANFLLVIALVHVDASVQYPMVTGGTMIVSTALCFLGEQKPSRREIISIILAFLGMVALFAIPL
jgi:drug/metabolite transporter (DMT)-like permease